MNATQQNWVVGACRHAPAINERNFPVKIVAIPVAEAPTRLAALRAAKQEFTTHPPTEPYTHIVILDGPSSDDLSPTE